jgi:RHS repeat-associated protein
LLRRTTAAYDLAGRKILKLDARGVRVTAVYDVAGQQVGELQPAGLRVTFGYDHASRRTLVADPTGRTSTVYDMAGQTTAVEQPLSKRVSYQYDLAGRRLLLRDPDGGRTTFMHDGAGQLTGLVSVQNGRTTLAYDGAGREMLKLTANGVRTTQSYDPAGREIGIYGTNNLGGLVRRLTYTLDGAGRRASLLTADGTLTSWTYDTAGQLTREQRNGSLPLALTHVYDPAGNRSLLIDTGARTSYTFDVANELLLAVSGSGRTTYQYDQAGNRTLKNAPTAATYYTWNAKSRMTVAEPVAGRVSLSYDGSGKRVTKEVAGDTTRYVWDFEKLLQEADGSSGAIEHQYLNTDQQYGDLVSGYDGTQTKFYELDALGSAQALLDDSGSPTDKYLSSAWGMFTQTLGTDPQPFIWVAGKGYQWDTETQLYYLGAGAGGGDNGRPFGSEEAQFLSTDPIGVDGGTNLYLNCNNDPVNCTDPSGHRVLIPQCLKGTMKDPSVVLREQLEDAFGWGAMEPPKPLTTVDLKDEKCASFQDLAGPPVTKLCLVEDLPYDVWGRIAYHFKNQKLNANAVPAGGALPGLLAWQINRGLSQDVGITIGGFKDQRRSEKQMGVFDPYTGWAGAVYTDLATAAWLSWNPCNPGETGISGLHMSVAG